MYETFEKLPQSKREEIMEVCIEEFAKNGYKNASTNTIVDRLGISKGVLFLYFKSKKNLYLYLFEHYSRMLLGEYIQQHGGEPGLTIDVFDNLGEFYKTLLQKKPELFVFLLDAFVRAPDEIKKEVEESHDRAHGNVYRNLKKDGLREGVDLETVVDMIHMVSFYVGQLIYKDYYGKDLTKAIREEIIDNIENYVEILSRYMDVLKYGVYEREK